MARELLICLGLALLLIAAYIGLLAFGVAVLP